MVDQVLKDPETSSLDEKHKALFRYLGKLCQDSTRITAGEIGTLKQVGWSEAAIYDALTVAALFQFYNTWIDGAGVQDMTPSDYLASGKMLSRLGYRQDFNFKGVLKMISARSR